MLITHHGSAAKDLGDNILNSRLCFNNNNKYK